VIKKTTERYNVRLVSYTVRDASGAVPDEIFEPGQEIVVSNIKVTNTGGMDLPAGAKIR
jgi:hypothetical protein